jgi:hypothetical protein
MVIDPEINTEEEVLGERFSKQTQAWGGSTISPTVLTPTTNQLQNQ